MWKPLKPTLLAVRTLPAVELASIVDNDEEYNRAEEEDEEEEDKKRILQAVNNVGQTLRRMSAENRQSFDGEADAKIPPTL